MCICEVHDFQRPQISIEGRTADKCSCIEHLQTTALPKVGKDVVPVIYGSAMDLAHLPGGVYSDFRVDFQGVWEGHDKKISAGRLRKDP